MRQRHDRSRDYDHESLRDERQYGFYWYSGLWRLLRPALVFIASLMIVFGVVSAVYQAIDDAFLSPVDPADETEIAFSVESGNSLTRVSNNLESQGLIKNSTFFKYYCDFAGLGQKIQAGDYLIKKSMDVFEIADLLTTGDGQPLTMDITIIPGDTIEDVANTSYELTFAMFALGLFIFMKAKKVKFGVLFVLLCRYPIFSSSTSAFFNCSPVPSASINSV